MSLITALNKITTKRHRKKRINRQRKKEKEFMQRTGKKGITRQIQNGKDISLVVLKKFFKAILKSFIIIGIAFSAFGMIALLLFFTETEGGENGNYKSGNNKKNYNYQIDDNGHVKAYEVEDTVDAGIKTFYNLLSQRSLYKQINGKLITYKDEEYGKYMDYYGREENLCLNPNLLYSANRIIFSNPKLVFPEAIMQPVKYEINNGIMTLCDLKKEKNEEIAKVGLGSIVTYKEMTEKSYIQGYYTKQEVWENGKIKEIDLTKEKNQPNSNYVKSYEEGKGYKFEIPISSSKISVFDEAVTFAGTVKYNYETTKIVDQIIKEGESPSELQMVRKYLYDTKYEKVTAFILKEEEAKKGGLIKIETEGYEKEKGQYKSLGESSLTIKASLPKLKQEEIELNSALVEAIIIEFEELNGDASITVNNATYSQEYKNIAGVKNLVVKGEDLAGDITEISIKGNTKSKIQIKDIKTIISGGYSSIKGEYEAKPIKSISIDAGKLTSVKLAKENIEIQTCDSEEQAQNIGKISHKLYLTKSDDTVYITEKPEDNGTSIIQEDTELKYYKDYLENFNYYIPKEIGREGDYKEFKKLTNIVSVPYSNNIFPEGYALGSRTDKAYKNAVDDANKEKKEEANGEIKSLKEYIEIFGDMFGVDPALALALVSQESGGEHYNHVTNYQTYVATNGAQGDRACGVFQLQEPGKIKTGISAKLRFTVDELEKLSVEKEEDNKESIAKYIQSKIGIQSYNELGVSINIENNKNIRISIALNEKNVFSMRNNCFAGIMNLASTLEYYKGNPYLALQGYNYSIGTMDKAVTAYAKSSGKPEELIIKNVADTGWQSYVIDIHENPYSHYGIKDNKGAWKGKYGDEFYVGHVLSYYDVNYAYKGDMKAISVKDKLTGKGVIKKENIKDGTEIKSADDDNKIFMDYLKKGERPKEEMLLQRKVIVNDKAEEILKLAKSYNEEKKYSDISNEVPSIWEDGFFVYTIEDSTTSPLVIPINQGKTFEQLKEELGKDVTQSWVAPIQDKEETLVVSSWFGSKDLAGTVRAGAHSGVDLTNPNDSQLPIHAVTDGVVTYVSNRIKNCKGQKNASWQEQYGTCVMVTDKNGIITIYAHMTYNSTKVNVGDKIKAGTLIGYEGNTGNSTAPHLHFGIQFNGVQTDPGDFIERVYSGIQERSKKKREM